MVRCPMNLSMFLTQLLNVFFFLVWLGHQMESYGLIT